MATQAEIDEVISNVAEGEFQKVSDKFFLWKTTDKKRSNNSLL